MLGGGGLEGGCLTNQGSLPLQQLSRAMGDGEGPLVLWPVSVYVRKNGSISFKIVTVNQLYTNFSPFHGVKNILRKFDFIH